MDSGLKSIDRRTFLAAAAVTPGVYAAGSGSSLNGRWDLTVPGNERKRAWWLEIKGTEGSFVGAPGGDCDPIRDLKITDSEATWSFSRPARENAKAWKGIYRARLEGEKLLGTLEVDGKTAERFYGVRAPSFQPTSTAKAKPGKTIDLFNGKDMTGWRAVRDNAPMLWKVENGILKNAPGTTDIVTEAKFMDFRLQGEYRVGPKSNSGIGLRGRYEVQILEDYGAPPNNHGNGALYSRILPTSNASKPANEWQTVDISLVGNTVSVTLNGNKVIDDKQIDGLTAIAIDPNEAEPGPLVIQGDHGSVEFRKLTLTPLLRT